MTNNPFLNAGAASLYIIVLTLVMFYGSQFAPKEDTIFAPMAMISLFTLSAAVMAYVFCLKPLQLFLAGKKSQAVTLFAQTIGVFAVITAILVFLFFSGALS